MSADLLSVASSGLSTARKALQTTGHNIANVNTEGFSRQRVAQVSNRPEPKGNVVLGAGAHVRSIDRIHSDFIERKLNDNLSENSYYAERSTFLSVIEDTFNEINYDGLNITINNFFNSFLELSNNPDSETSRSLIRENAKILINKFKQVRENLNNVSQGIDDKINQYVIDVNSLAESIARLNVKIQAMENTYGVSGDLLDERDLYLRKMAEYFTVSTFINEHNQYVVNAKGVGSIVIGKLFEKYEVGNTIHKEKNPPFPMAKEILQHRFPVTKKFRQGKMAALFDTRKDELSLLIKKIDSLAFGIGNIVNAIHRKGFANKNVSMDSNGNPIKTKENFNIDFFNVPNEVNRAAQYLDLSEMVKVDLNNIVTALAPNTRGDNRVALALAKLQDLKVAKNGTTNFENDYLETIGEISLTLNRNKVALQQTEGILAQVKSLRERISGVSIDEETANLSKYQHAYDASARVMKVADEMMKEILNLRR